MYVIKEYTPPITHEIVKKNKEKGRKMRRNKRSGI
jgi:hypothetical protein